MATEWWKGNIIIETMIEDFAREVGTVDLMEKEGPMFKCKFCSEWKAWQHWAWTKGRHDGMTHCCRQCEGMQGV